MTARALRLLAVRLVMAALAALVVSAAVFVLEHAMPGDPCLGEGAAAIRLHQRCLHQLNLDQPLAQQYLNYLRYVVSGAISPDLVGRAITSLELGGLALAWALAAGVWLGLRAAARQGRGAAIAGQAAMAFAVGIPNFAVAGLIAYFATTVLGNLTGSVIYYTGGWGQTYQWIPPLVALGLWPAGYIARLVRGGALEAMRQDYVATARAKGLSEARVLRVHVLRNGLLPLLSLPAPLLMATLGGSIVVENIFHVPGLGSAAVPAILSRNYETVVESAVYYTLLVGILNALADVAAMAADPRIGRSARP